MREYKTKKDVELIEKKRVFQGFFALDLYRLKFKLFSGEWSHEIEREMFERGDTVAVLPYDPVRKEVILIEQFRAAALKDEVSPWLLEAVAGMVEKGEANDEVAVRELKEETGLHVSKLIPISRFWLSQGGTSETCQLYCAEIDAAKASEFAGLPEENEDIKVHRVSFEKAFEWVESGYINTVPAIIGLQWLRINHVK